MIFSAELMPKVLAGEKTETRRVVRYVKDEAGVGEALMDCFYKPGRRYPLQPGRTKKAVGRVIVESVQLERAGDIGAESVQREGFASQGEFLDYVAALWKCTPADALARPVWAIRFHLEDAQ